jgi:uncharacterized caspase-like protein
MLAVLASGLQVFAQAQSDDGKSIFVRAVNQQPAFGLHLAVDKPDRAYVKGDRVTVSVVSEREGFLYLFYFHGEEPNPSTLFPNPWEQNNFIQAKKQILVPGSKAQFVLECDAPYGKGILTAVVSSRNLNDVFGNSAQGQNLKVPTPEELKKFVDRVTKQEKKDWAEAQIEIITSDKMVVRKPRRFAVCIGIGPYRGSIPPLQVSHLDAQRFAQALKQECGVEDVVLLINEQATRAAIETAVFRDLGGKAQPGDTVFIFYSGHGWRVSDTNGDEQDGFDEVLVPYDAEFGKPETMILDDTFARWMQKLDGCNIGIVLDNCYSGGASKGIKGLGDKPGGPLDFFDGELNRAANLKRLAKDLNQSGTMVLAACQAGQLAWEMPTAGQGSVLTYHILQLIGPVPANQKTQQAKAVKDADANRDGKLSIGELFRAIQEPVQRDVQEKFQERQTPVLLDNANDRIVIRPY